MMFEYFCQDCRQRGFTDKKLNMCPNKKCKGGLFLIYFPIEENKYDEQIKESNDILNKEDDADNYFDYYFGNGNI